MHKTVLTLAAITISAEITLAQSGPKEAIDITHAQIEAVLKAGAARTPPAIDQTLRVIDMGTYAMSVGVVHRGPTGQPPAGGRGAAAPAHVASCGLAEAPAGAQMSPPGMIAHDQTTETYIVISGSGTLVTGGQIVNGRRSGPESEVTKILNGPSCSGRAAGNIVSRKMNVGDISVIPAGVPHGWADITDHVDYLSVRPDPDKVLEHGYVNPAIAGAK
jgi:mannose-6-phosphate isomerase-like protein (cupin superfamily)